MPHFLPDLDRLSAKLTGRLPLRAVFLTVVVGTLVGTVGLVSVLSFRNGQKAVSDLASQLRREISSRIVQELKGYFATPHDINRLNADAFAQGNIDVSGGRFGESQLYQQLVVSSTVAFVYCGSEQSGEFFGVLRSPDDGSLQLSYSNATTQFLREFYGLDVGGNRTFWRRRMEQPYDARERPWYQRARASQQPIWSDVYISFSTGLPTVTAAMPVYDRTGQKLLGVCGTDVALPEEFRTFLQNLTIGKTGQAFVVDREGHLIANSTPEPLILLNQGETAQLLAATQSQSPLVRETATYLSNYFGDLQTITASQQLEFRLAGQRQFVQVVPFRDEYGLDWLIVVVLPASDFMAQIYANTRNTLLLCLVIVALAILFSLFTTRWLTRQILQISQASDKLAQGDMDQHISSSPIAEINTMANSFNQMTQKLHTSFEVLVHTEDRNRALLDAIPDLMVEISADGRYLDCLEAKGDDWRPIHAEDWFGKPVQETLPPAIAEQYLKAVNAVLHTGQPQTLEYQLWVASQWQTFEARVVPCKAESALFIVRNITERKQSEESLRIAEEKYRSIFENALEGIFQSSPEGQFINVNPALAKIYGYDSPAEMIATITDIGEQLWVHPEKRIKFRELLEQKNSIKNFEYRCYCKDGTIIWTQIDARVVRDNQGQVLYYEGIVQDITERIRREDELKQQLAELKIEIDHQKRQEEVTSFTQSSYFLEVQREIAQVNLDEFWS